MRNILLVMAWGLAAITLLAIPVTSRSQEMGFKDSYKSDFLKECKRRVGIPEYIEEKSFDEYCECLVGQIMDNYKEKELRKAQLVRSEDEAFKKFKADLAVYSNKCVVLLKLK